MTPYQNDPYGIMFVMNPVPPLEYPNEITPLPNWKVVPKNQQMGKQINEEDENLWKLLEEVRLENDRAKIAFELEAEIEEARQLDLTEDDPDLIDSPDHKPIDLGKEPL